MGDARQHLSASDEAKVTALIRSKVMSNYRTSERTWLLVIDPMTEAEFPGNDYRATIVRANPNFFGFAWQHGHYPEPDTVF